MSNIISIHLFVSDTKHADGQSIDTIFSYYTNFIHFMQRKINVYKYIYYRKRSLASWNG